MRSSIYDALEVSSSAPTNAVQVALRGVVRRFWAVPRDASGDSEEAVRFAALGASILVDPMRRKDYDAALNPGVGAGPWRLPTGGQSAQDGSTNSRALGEGSAGPSQVSIEATPPKPLPGVDALAEPLPDGKAWASPLVFVAVAGAWLLLCYACTSRFSESLVTFGIGAAVLVATGASALLFAASMWLSRSKEPDNAAASLSRLAIIKWRREGSIFIGVPAPQHDTAWIFKLRLMELTRSAAGFITATSVLRRTTARMIDYALVALVVYLAVNVLNAVVSGFDLWFVVLRSPLVLPIAAVLAAIPIEAACYRAARTTPGKWLLGMMPVLGATRPADHQAPSDSQLAWARSARAAWNGAALGFWPLALARLPRNLRLAHESETEWDATGDSVMMARPLVAPAVATGLIVLLSTALILFAAWRHDYIETMPQVVKASASLQASLTEMLGLTRGASSPESTRSPAATEPAIPSSVATVPATSVTQAPVTKPEPTVPSKPLLTPHVADAVPVAPSPTTNSAAATEMARQTDAAHARRVRIDGYGKQAEAARRSGSYAGLLGNCQRWTQDQPGSAEAWRCLGLAQYQSGVGREALPALRQALRLEPNDAQVESAILRILRP